MLVRLFKSAPKWVLVALIIGGSTALFSLWWLGRHFRRWGPMPAGASAPAKPRPEPKIAGREDRLLLVDNDLYDVESGTLLATQWLENGMPDKLFYDAAAKKFLAQYQNGFVRYATNGAVEATMLRRFPPTFFHDFKWMLFVKDKDIWRADVDWQEFKLVNERKITAIEQFHEPTFAENVVLGTEKTILVRNAGKELRVNLETGDVKPIRLPLDGIRKRRSPDSKHVVGMQQGEFYCYDVDTDDAKSIKVGRGVMSDYLWLDNDRCVAIAAAKTVVIYDRVKHTLDALVPLPFPCQKIGELSPSGRFVFCLGGGKGVLVDVERKKAEPVVGGAGVSWLSDDTFIFSREVPDSSLRGIWIQKTGENEKRISAEPYYVQSSGAQLMHFSTVGLIIFSTKHSLNRMSPDGSDARTLCLNAGRLKRILGVMKTDTLSHKAERVPRL